MSVERGHPTLHNPLTFLSTMVGRKLINGQWPVRTVVVHCALSGHARGHTRELAVVCSVWFCGWHPIALKGGCSPCFLEYPSPVSWSTVGTAGDLLPSKICLSVFSFSPFLVKESGGRDWKVPDRWHREGKERELEFQQQQECEQEWWVHSCSA